MPASHRIAMLGAGFIGDWYTRCLCSQRRRDRVELVYSRTLDSARTMAERYGIERTTDDLAAAIGADDIDVVVVALPNHQHEEAVRLAAEAGKAVLCTKPLGRTAEEARRMLDLVEEAGIFHGYLEDLVYTPKTLHALGAVRAGALGDVLWVRSRECHPGPHSGWFWDAELAGGGVLLDMGCHCVEIGRSFIGKHLRPVEVMCWTATQVHPIDAEDHGIGWVRYANGALGQFEVSWTFRGGLDVRDEVQGTEGTVWLDHFLRTGYEMYSSGRGGYVAEKAETESGWLFPVGDESKEMGYDDMFTDMLDALDENRSPRETFYDGWVINAILDAAYRSAESKRWESVDLGDDWRGESDPEPIRATASEYEGQILVKQERMPDGSVKRILKDPETGRVTDTVEKGGGR